MSGETQREVERRGTEVNKRVENKYGRRGLGGRRGGSGGGCPVAKHRR